MYHDGLAVCTLVSVVDIAGWAQTQLGSVADIAMLWHPTGSREASLEGQHLRAVQSL